MSADIAAFCTVRKLLRGNLTNAGTNNNTSHVCVQAMHPCALQHLHSLLARVSGKRMVVFLDYDGTLTPIVSNPDRAVMSLRMRRIVRAVGESFPTAIISGRGRQKVEDFVQLPELFYAGSHGLDIKGPVVCMTAALLAVHFLPSAVHVHKLPAL